MDKVIFTGGFNRGLGIFRNGKQVAIVPECTYWDDDHMRVVERDGSAIIQIEAVDSEVEQWNDCRNLGPVNQLTRSGYDDDGEHDVHICSNDPLMF